MAIKSSNQITFTEYKKIVEIKEWYLATNQNQDVTIETDGWTESIQIINEENSYLWNYEEVIYSIGSSDISEPVIIGYYGQGSDGKSIVDIQNEYLLTNTPELPESPEWSNDTLVATGLSPENKYLWNREVITYTVGDPTETTPAIIGVYGDSGADAITFEIYSTQGFIFKEDMDEIELKIAAFQGQTAITNATFTWEWWDSTLNDGNGGYSLIIEGDVNTPLIIYKWDKYALAHLKCTMSYNDSTYEDYVDLTNEAVIYTAVVRYFNGSNIFNSSVPYIIAYLDLYRNNILVESVSTNKYYTGNNTISGGIITSDIDGTFSDGDLIYFIYSDGSRYKIVLGKYESGSWNVVNSTNNYIYTNDLYTEDISNIMIVSKEDVVNTRDITFKVYKALADDSDNYICNDDTYVATTNTIVVDINDPIISATEPENANYGQLWLDTSSTPYKLYIYTQTEGQDDGTWKYFSQQNGGAIYTSFPKQYEVGDLWILESKYGNYEEGTMLRAIGANFNVSSFVSPDWEDAMYENTMVLSNIKQYFEFNADTGLKIGQSDEKFYVNINSTEMGFYDATSGKGKKVVSISNESATIKDLTVEEGAAFDCNAEFNGEISFGAFVWKIESSNGSLSLAIPS